MCSSHANSSYVFHPFKKASNEESKFFPEKQKGFRDGPSYSTSQRSSETRRIVTTHLQLTPIPEIRIHIMPCALRACIGVVLPRGETTPMHVLARVQIV